MKYLHRTKLGVASLLFAAIPVVLLYVIFSGKNVDAGLTSGTPTHTHSGITTGGSTLTRPNLQNASAFTLSTSDDTTDATITTANSLGRFAVTTSLGTAALYLDPGNVTETGVSAPVLGNYSDGANVGYVLRTNTVDASDTTHIQICGTGICDVSRGATINLYGNESTQGGDIDLVTGNSAGTTLGLSAGQTSMTMYYNSDIILNALTGNNIVLTASSGRIDVNTRIASTAPCETGYTRKTVDFCARDTMPSVTTLVRDNCHGVTSPSSSAKMIQLQFSNLIFATGSPVVSTRSTVMRFFSNSSCTTETDSFESVALQRLADTDSLQIASFPIQAIHKSNATSFYVMQNDDSGNVGRTDFRVTGYYD